jgi:hypothetical protein
MHFALLDRRLRTLGAAYGDLPAHAGLWEARRRPAHDPLARLAVVPTVLEARGLDVTPATVAALERAGDTRSAAILNRIYRDEIRHVAAGMRWFHHGANPRRSAGEAWRRLVSRISAACLSRRSTIQRAMKPVCPGNSTWACPLTVLLTVCGRVSGWAPSERQTALQAQTTIRRSGGVAHFRRSHISEDSNDEPAATQER